MIDFLICYSPSRSTNAQAIKYSKLFSRKKRLAQGMLFGKISGTSFLLFIYFFFKDLPQFLF